MATILILILAAIAGITYYLGTPTPAPGVIPMTSCGGDPDILITNSQDFKPPPMNLVIGTNSTVAWTDDYSGAGVNVISRASPFDGPVWDLNMTDATPGNTQCIALTVPGTYVYEVSSSEYDVPGTITVTGVSSTQG